MARPTATSTNGEPTAGTPPRPVPTAGNVSVVARENMESLLGLDESTTDPNMHYRFVSDNPLRVARHRLKGYRPVTSADGVRTLVEPNPAEDGLIRVGDTLLMCCPRAAFHAGQARKSRVAESRLGHYREGAKEQIAQAQHRVGPGKILYDPSLEDG